jgi:hypothetical protein
MLRGGLGGALDVSVSLYDRVGYNGCFWVGDVTLGHFTDNPNGSVPERPFRVKRWRFHAVLEVCGLDRLKVVSVERLVLAPRARGRPSTTSRVIRHGR